MVGQTGDNDAREMGHGVLVAGLVRRCKRFGYCHRKIAGSKSKSVANNSGKTFGQSGITTGNKGLDGILGDSTLGTGKTPQKGLGFPGSIGDLKGAVTGLPGAKTEPQSGGGTTVTLPDGTKVSFPRGRRKSTKRPGFEVTRGKNGKVDSNRDPQIKGDAETDADSSDSNSDNDSGSDKK